MRAILFSVLVIAISLAMALPAYADGPIVSDEGKLWGITKVMGGPDADDHGPDHEIMFDVYEQSNATVIYVDLNWWVCEPEDPGDGPSNYDFSSLDEQLHMQSSKTKVCWIGLGNSWADKIKEDDPGRYQELAERFVTAATRYANTKGIKYFQVPGTSMTCLVGAIGRSFMLSL